MMTRVRASHQQPPGEPLLDRMHRVARCGLHDQPDMRVHVPRHELVERAPAVDLLAKWPAVKPITYVCRRLHHRDRRCPLPVIARENTDHAFSADGRDFHHVARLQHGQFRDEAATRKVDVLDGLPGSVQDFFDLE
jgi:hypothetical protein